MPRTPLRDGWRVLMRAPGVIVSEIVWRWTFGLAFWALLFFSFHTYLSAIEISPSEYALIKGFAPFTWMAITIRIMAALIEGFRAMSPILLPGLCVLWVALTSVGRAASVRALAAGQPHTHWPALVGLNIFRVLMLAASLLAYFGAGALVSSIVDPQAHFGLNLFLVFVVLLVLSGIYSIVNWFFSAAAIFAARDRAGFRESLKRAAGLYYTKAGGTGIWFSLMRSTLVLVSSVVSLILFGALLRGSRLLPLVAISLITLAYFAAADALYVWRLATYISLTEPEREIPAPLIQSEPPVLPGSEPELDAGPEARAEDLWTPSEPPLTEELEAES